MRTVLAVSLAGLAHGAAAQHEGREEQPARFAALSLAELEDAFWVCDYRATLLGTGDSDLAACGAVYEALKVRKFGGDFDQLLRWWRENKPLQHGRLAGGDQSS